MKPVVVLVGRPNVGKSTLFNRLTRSRAALVADVPGLTRDRQYGDGRVGDRPYFVVDTGGVVASLASAKEQGDVSSHVAVQVRAALAEADAVILLVDTRRPGGWGNFMPSVGASRWRSPPRTAMAWTN